MTQPPRLLTETIDDFHLHQASMGLAPSTIQNSVVTMNALIKHVGTERRLTAVTDTAIAEFMLTQARTRRASSLAQTHVRLQAFFKWCAMTGRIKATANPMNGRRAPRFAKRERNRIHVSQFPHLLNVAGESCPRDRMLVALGLFTMLRDQDMAELRIRDVELASGTIKAYIAKSRIEDTLIISPILDKEIRAWFMEYQRMCGPLRPDWRLLPFVVRPQRRGAGGQLMRTEVEALDPYKNLGKSGRFVRPILESAGFPITGEDGAGLAEGSHTLRRSGARALYDVLVADGRVDALRIVQTALHHKNVVQTQDYIGLDPDRETRDNIMRTLRYGFEDVDVIGGYDGGREDDELAPSMRQVRQG